MQRIGFAIILAVVGTARGALGQAEDRLKSRFDAVVKAQDEASARYHGGLAEAKTPESSQAAIDRFLKDVHKNTEDALDMAKAYPNNPLVIDVLKFVVRTARAGPGDESYRAMEILARDHTRAPGMGEFCGQCFYFFHSPVSEKMIRSVLATHPNRDDRGFACHALAEYLKYKAKMVRRLRESPDRIKDYEETRGKNEVERFVKETDPDAQEKEAEWLLERVVAEFGDVKHPLDKRTEGEFAAGELFAMRNLTVGKVAPEIEGKDDKGTTFRLSDYRGKVVVLTFSGNWCGPCVAMYPQQRTLISKWKDKPFALLSVTTDSTLETLAMAIDEGKITWRCWWDGGTDGPITTRWGVGSFPSIFVLDKQGVIRFMDVKGKDFDAAVDSLLEK